MSSSNFFLLLVFATSAAAYVNITDNVIEGISEFIGAQNKPTTVTAFLCWPNDKTIYLTKKLNTYGVFVSTNPHVKFLNSSLPSFWPAEHQLYLIDLDCHLSENILNKANSDGFFNFPYRWIILQNHNNFGNFDMLINSRIYVAQKSEKFFIQSIYKIKKFSGYLTNDVAKWNGNRLEYNRALFDYKNRSDLMGMEMNISLVAIFDRSKKHFNDFRERHVDSISKFNYVLVNHVADKLNITRRFIFHNTWGLLDPKTKKYNGLIGDLQSNVSEMAGTGSFITNDRIRIIDYFGATTPTRAKFIFRAPALSMVTNVFTLPFTTTVWYASYVLLFVIFLVVFIITKWEWRSGNTIENKHLYLRPTAIDVIQFEIGAICQQGSEAEPKGGPGRIASFSIFLTLMFLYTSYSANIVALLQSTTDSIRSLEDLLNFRIQLGVEEVPYSRYYSQMQTGKIHKELYDKKVAPAGKPDNYMTAEVGVKRMKEEFFAFHAESNTIYAIVSETFSESEKCGLKEVEFWRITDPVVPIKKNSTYRELVKISYAMILERGLQSRNYRRVYTKKPTCSNNGANFMSVSITDCYFTLMAYGLGSGLAIVIYVLEFFMARAKNAPARCVKENELF